MEKPTDKQIENLLTQNIVSIKDFPYEIIIKSIFNKKVKKFDTDKNKICLNRMAQAMKDICKKSESIRKSRRNEVGNAMENIVILALNRYKLSAEKPKTSKGKNKTTGYPDIKIKTSDTPIYLEVKTYEKKNYQTSFRSFYFSPSKDPKIDAFHLLVGFEIIEKDNNFIPVAFELLDLYGLKCDLKYEFNSNNRRLYNKKHILIRGDKNCFKGMRL
ncbi:MAG: hypothetical protein OXJ52_01065 [Oligoflexia bacterium]|nr:hypothetical protein [Oligoflexia bacterium]